ncbi:MAG: protein kinase [Myxococcales bacterium]|nr:protein kinase [Myxococcales bacterium]
MDPAPGALVGEKYRLERALARGGMGAVWAARHLTLDVPVAIKFMGSAAGSSLLRARFEREARAAASLRSPHVVQVLDYGSCDGSPFIVMEMLEGEDLAHRLARVGTLGLPEIAKIVAELAKGLTLAHEAGIVHRDLKPSNVFLARVGQEEIAKILDFGVAKETRLDSPAVETTAGTVIGSPSYMSPEQARGGEVDARSDLWSVAVIVYQALVGERPFAGTSLGDVLVRICSDPLPVASSRASDLPPEVDAFFERALCRSPDGRYQSARELAEALTALAAGAPSRSPRSPPGPVPRLDVTASVAAISARSPDVATEAGPLAPPAPTTIREETAAPIETSPSLRGAAVQAPPRRLRRVALLALGAASLVAAGGFAAFRAASGARPSASADEATALAVGAAVGSVVMTEPSSQSPGPLVAPGDAAVGAPPSASASGAPQQSASAPQAPVAAPARLPARPRGTVEVDPKFGLPGAR